MANAQQHSQSMWSPEAITAFLQQMRIPIRLASVTSTGWPLVVSLWYLYENGRLYCATQKTAKIVAHLRREPRCAFEVAADLPPYRGVRGQGKAAIIPERGEEMLSRLLERYLKDTSSSLAQLLLARSADEVAIEIEPVALTTWDFTARMRDSSPNNSHKE
jgi:nitroimidazol reductase NimA-like FMN-containing flavoprotein (pyridoxamine 5'-phosphate oxidase superfamily)